MRKVLKNYSLFALLCLLLCMPGLAAASPFQVITPSSTAVSATAGGSFQFDVSYTTSPLDETLSGLGLIVHYDSTQLTLNAVPDPYGSGTVQASAETIQQDDGDPNTDQVVVFSWFDTNAAWPGVGTTSPTPLKLFTISFTASASLASSTQINFTSSTSVITDDSSGIYTLLATPVSVTRYVDQVPVVTAPANIVKEATGATTTVSLGTATATDAEDGTLTPTTTSTGLFAVGVHDVVWQAMDSANNTGTAVQTVTITDNTPPVVSAPAAITLEATGYTTAVALGQAAATDLVDGALTATANQLGPFTVGVHTVTWSATDSHNNVGTATQVITITDTTAPQVVAPSDIDREATGPYTEVSLFSATVTDLVDGSGLVASPYLGDNPITGTPLFEVGVHTVTWKVTDSAGNPGQDTQVVIIRDTTNPTIVAPANKTAEALATLTSVNLGQPVVSDSVDQSLTVVSDAPVAGFPVGTTTVTWTATDDSGNSASATQTVTITFTGLPTVFPPADLIVEAAGALTTVDLGTATARDFFVEDITPVLPNQTGPFAIGVHSIIWTASNATGAATATQTVTVQDTAGPFVTAPANITLEATGATTAVTLGTATAVDVVDGSRTASVDDPGPFSVGVHTLTWSATDTRSNVGTATQTVTITDNTAPMITAPAAISIEATGVTTAVALGTATATDNVDSGLSPSPDNTGPFAVGAHTVTWSVTDTAGNSASATQTVTITDTTPPTITALAGKTVGATGVLTDVALGTPTATDIADATPSVTVDDVGPYAPGRHVLTWTATDDSGNHASVSQIVDVSPRADFAANQVVGEGSADHQVEVKVYLNGTAPVYPVTIPYTVAGGTAGSSDHTATSGNLVINSGRLGVITFNVLADAVTEVPETVIFQMMTPFTGAVPGVKTLHVVTITEANVAPAVSLNAIQNNKLTREVLTTGGTVTLSANVRDPNPGDTHTYNWSGTDNSLVANPGTGGSANDVFAFEPAALAPGLYRVSVSVTDSGTSPLTSSDSMLIYVLASVPPLATSTDDTDGDGLANNDPAEGLGDIDGDGIPNYLDSDAIGGNRIPVDDDVYMTTEPGLRLKIGPVAFALASDRASVPAEGIAEYGAYGGLATNTADGSMIPVGGYFDFRVEGLPTIGGSARVVIPLIGNAVIPANAYYRKYSPATGWRGFSSTGANALASASRDALGLCPEPGSPSFTTGLTAGDDCVQLTIVDGGPNDSDGEPNGKIDDPGTVASPVPPTPSSGGGGGGAFGPGILLLGLCGLGLRRRGLRL